MDQNLHVIHSESGHLTNRTITASADIAAMVAALKADRRKHLILHFHGGLVSRGEGLKTVEKLMPVYSPSGDKGGYPIFFVWESSFLEAMQNNLGDLARETAFTGLRDKLLRYLLGKLGVAMFTESSTQRELMVEVEEMVGVLPEEALRTMADDALPRVNEEEIKAELEADPELMSDLSRLPQAPPELASPYKDRLEPHHTWVEHAMAEAFAADGPPHFHKAHDGGSWTLFQVAWFLGKVARAVLGRMRSGRDHGLYATCVEELMRAITVRGTGLNEWGKKLQWNLMKDDTRDAFGSNPRSAGTALLNELAAAMKADDGRLELERITLVGHSTGAIYIRHWLEHSARLGAIKQDVVFLAPAITHREFAQLLSRHGERIGKFRMFGMQDEHERKDQLWGRDDEELERAGGQDWRRFLYPASLLYLVSGLLESHPGPGDTLVDAPDMPLLGLHRHLQDTTVYRASDFPEIDAVRAWLRLSGHCAVWSKTVNAAPGFECDTIDHGRFDDGKQILRSLGHIVTEGF